jgi:hypothetical protein
MTFGRRIPGTLGTAQPEIDKQFVPHDSIERAALDATVFES